jgi:hypothetical protein
MQSASISDVFCNLLPNIDPVRAQQSMPIKAQYRFWKKATDGAVED